MVIPLDSRKDVLFKSPVVSVAALALPRAAQIIQFANAFYSLIGMARCINNMSPHSAESLNLVIDLSFSCYGIVICLLSL